MALADMIEKLHDQPYPLTLVFLGASVILERGC